MKPVIKNGFTLIEMAMVLMIVGLLLGGMLVPLSAQMDQRNVTDTRKTLDDIQQALIGYAIINGRLPCPASSTSNGAESFAGGGNASNGNCSNFPSNFYNGFVPAATLGLSGTDSSGYAIDAWGNRIHYAVTSWTSSSNYVFTRTGGMSGVGLANFPTSGTPYLQVCTAASTSTSSCSVANSSLTSSPGVPAVIYSTGKISGTGADELENADNNRVFVSHTPTSSAAANGEFDDIVIWISPNVLINRMVSAGTLP